MARAAEPAGGVKDMTEDTRSERHGFAFARTAEHRARTLTAGSIGTAGMLFGVLFGTCVTIVRSTAGRADETGAWLADGTASLEWALGLLPFAGIFFTLVHRRVATAPGGGMTGSSPRDHRQRLAVPAMVFAAAGLVGGRAHDVRPRSQSGVPGNQTYLFVRSRWRGNLFGIYAMRMAACSSVCQATAWLRHGLIPKWLALPSDLVALVLRSWSRRRLGCADLPGVDLRDQRVPVLAEQAGA